MGTITGFERDEKGFLWIGTAEGLHRFDGKNLKVFKYQEGNLKSLTDSYITSLLCKGDKLYIGNNLGQLDILDVNTFKVSSIDFKQGDSTFDNSITQLIYYQKQIVINTDGGGIWLYHPIEQRFRKLEVEDLNNQVVQQLYIEDEKLHLLTSSQLIGTNFNTSEILFSKPLGFTSIAKLGDRYLLGTTRGLFETNKKFSEWNVVPLPPRKRLINRINKIITDNDIAWIGTDGGLLRIKNNSIQLFTTNALRPFSLVDNQVSQLYLDQENILWVGTIAGVSKYAPQMGKFGLLQYFDFEGTNYNNNTYNIYEDRQNNIWLGTLTSGLIQLDEKNNIAAVYPKIEDGEFTSKSVRAIFEDSKGTLWIGTRSEGIFTFDRQTTKFTHVASTDLGNLESNIIRDFFEDSEGRLWVGTQSGLSLKDSVSDQFYHFRSDLKHQNNTIYQIEEDSKTGNLILASFRGGLQIFNPTTASFQVYRHKKDDTTSISNNNLMSLEWINSDSLFIGTYGGGLNIFDLRSGKFTSITETDGLANNAVYGVTYQGDGIVWLSTNNGLVKYNYWKNNFTSFKPVHYLQSTEYNEGAFLKGSNGMFYFGGVSGINFFTPENLKTDTAAPPIYITGTRGAINKQTSEYIELSFINSRLEIDYAALDYSNPDGVKYEYKLIGYENNWVQAGNNQTAVYARLSPGNYQFKVRARDEFGKWEVLSDSLKVEIIPPFWQKWWFIGLVLLVVFGLVYAVFKYRTREIERSYKLQLLDSELAALRSQMNPHFIFNSLNSIQYFILKKEPREAYTYLSKFASLMRKILQNSRLKYISVADEIEGLDLYLEMEKLRMDNNLDYSVDIENIEDPEHTYMPTMLIQPFVENSIVHGLLPKENNRILKVKITKTKDQLVCTIKDNGIGRKASRAMNAKRSSKHTSTGMALTEKRLKILSEGKGNFNLEINDLLATDGETGTEVKLVISVINQTD